MKKKVNVSLDDKLLKDLDVLADELHVSRSGAISVAISNYIQQKTVIDNMPLIIKAYENEIKA